MECDAGRSNLVRMCVRGGALVLCKTLGSVDVYGR